MLRPSGALLLAVVSLAGYALVTALVLSGATASLDEAAKELFRPGDMWSTPQFLVGDIIDGFKPLHVAVGTAVLTGWLSRRRRTWRPTLVAGCLLVTVAAVTWVSKVLVDRPDTHGTDSGGSYPSGHVAVLLVALGALVLVSPRRRRWAWPAVVGAVGVMTVSLLVQATHWLTDLVGGALLGTFVLAVSVLLGLGAPSGTRGVTG